MFGVCEVVADEGSIGGWKAEGVDFVADLAGELEEGEGVRIRGFYIWIVVSWDEKEACSAEVQTYL